MNLYSLFIPSLGGYGCSHVEQHFKLWLSLYVDKCNIVSVVANVGGSGCSSVKQRVKYWLLWVDKATVVSHGVLSSSYHSMLIMLQYSSVVF
jgi:hypothetical protein